MIIDNFWIYSVRRLLKKKKCLRNIARIWIYFSTAKQLLVKNERPIEKKKQFLKQ